MIKYQVLLGLMILRNSKLYLGLSGLSEIVLARDT